MQDMYKQIKRLKGETFAQELRNYHNGLLEIQDLDKIVRHAGQEAGPLLPYLMSLLSANDDRPVLLTQDPFVLLDQAGYTAFYADTLNAQNSIKKYFQPGELLCTFNDSARYQDYHIVHAIKKDVDSIHRADFKGKEEREDAYGTSVISIQMLKSGGFISIKNRYNHSVKACDNTFNSNPDNIIDGLSAALRGRFNVAFSASNDPLPDGFVLLGKQVFKYHEERNNIYYGDQVWAENGVIHEANKSAGDALFEGFLFDNKSKTLKKIDPSSNDSFADDFNRCYGGNRGLAVQNGNLALNGEVLIGAEKSRIKTLFLPALEVMGDYCLNEARALTRFEAKALTTMGGYCLYVASALTRFEAKALMTMGDYCLYEAPALTQFEANRLTSIGNYCLRNVPALTRFEAHTLTTMGNECLNQALALTQFEANTLTTMRDGCLFSIPALTQFKVNALTMMGDACLHGAPALTQFEANTLKTMGDNCLYLASALTRFEAKALTTMGYFCLSEAPALTQVEAKATMPLRLASVREI